MELTLHFHPLSSYCWKALIALYEANLPFTPELIDLGDPASRAAFAAIWPLAKMPVLTNGDDIIPEASIIIEYLAETFPAASGPAASGPAASGLIPENAEAARNVRFADRFYDLYVQTPMQKIVGDRLRPNDDRDDYGVREARASLTTALGIIDREMGDRHWAAGDRFTMADCAAAPALFYADKITPLADDYPAAHAFLERLKARPSFARVLIEAEPYFQYFPSEYR